MLWNCRCLCGRAGCWPRVQFLPQNGRALDPRWSPCLLPYTEEYLWESYNCTVWSQDLGKCCLPAMSVLLLSCLLQPSCPLWAVVLSAWVISRTPKGPESVLQICFCRRRKFSTLICFQYGLLPWGCLLPAQFIVFVSPFPWHQLPTRVALATEMSGKVMWNKSWKSWCWMLPPALLDMLYTISTLWK